MLTFAILSYNHPVITARCVSSVLKWLPAENIALLHNGSEIRHILDLETQFPQIQHWHLEKNKGYTVGVNEIFRRGFEKSDWIFLLTNDTELTAWDLDLLKLQSGIYSPLVWLRKVGRVDSFGGLFDSRRGRLQHLKWPVEKKDLSWGQFPYAPGTAFLLSRKVHQILGVMDESLHTYWEDVDYGARAAKQGVLMGFLPTVQLIHQGRKTTGKNSYYTNFLFQRNRVIVSWRHCPLVLRWMLVPLWIKNRLSTARFGRSHRSR